MAEEVHEEGGREGRVPDRHDDRGAARAPSPPTRSPRRPSSSRFGTNDLTQMTFGFSRDDIKGFMPTYLKEKILPIDPFQTHRRRAASASSSRSASPRAATAARRSTASTSKVGICGEHGGDPDSVAFCHKVGMDYVSCSPFRVPIARLAAAQAALGETARDK